VVPWAGLRSGSRKRADRRLTRAHLGRDLSPHLFRDCAATSIAVRDPEHGGIIKDDLGHTTFKTGEKFYNQADMTSALRRFQVAVMAAPEDRRLAPTLHPGQTSVMARENNNPSP
jgi:integrase